tara:strand:+ start:3668 stop:7087 length:3420 start_codon:yes stop_codon:yes gene_type:complete
MRTFIFLFCTAVFSFSSGDLLSQNSKIIIDADKTLTIDEVFDMIDTQTEYSFIYKSDMFKDSPGIKIKKGTIRANKLLKQILSTGKFNVVIGVNNTIIIKEKTIEIIKPQDIEISGLVTDQTGQPLPGANIIEKGTTNGAQTDFDGKFSLTLQDEKAILIISYIGYLPVEIVVGDQTNLSITLLEDAAKLDEVVVVGYGTQSKKKVTGAVSSVKSEAIQKYATGNFEQALSGTMSGIQVNQGGRNPGEDSNIVIRGVGTLTAGSNPLIVMDGVPLSEGSSLSSINSSDIASIDVLKDAASAAIYGSRAANGVLLITTKKGKSGDLKINFSTYSGIQTRSSNIELLNAYDAAQFFKEARDWGYVSKDPTNRSASDNNATRVLNGANKRQLTLEYTQPYLDGVQGLTDTDWIDEVYRPANINNYYLSLAGGTNKTNYFVSFGYLDQEGIIVGSNTNRLTSNIRINTDISDKLKFGINVNTSYAKSDILGDVDGWGRFPADPGAAYHLMYPFFSVHNPDGSFAISEQIRANQAGDAALQENPVAMALLSKNNETKFRIFGSTFLEYEIIEGLKFKSSIGTDYRNTFFDYFQPSGIGQYRTDAENFEAHSSEKKITVENLLFENTLTYKKKFNDNHNFNFLAGYSYQEEIFNDTGIDASGITDNNLDNIASGSIFSVDAQREKWTQISYFGRMQYDYKSKYLMSAALRTDGSSRFGDNSKWGLFKSFSAGWVLSNEEFFPEESKLSSVKLRASWGETGNNQIGAYGSQGLVDDTNYNIDGVLIPGSAPSTSPNSDLSWETNTSLNFGVNLGFLENKISFSADYYVATTKDLLLQVPVPQQSGYDVSLQNIGKVENRGFEIDLRGNRFKVGNVELGFNANLTTNKNEVLALGPDQDQIITNVKTASFRTKVGGQISELYGYDVIGVYKTQAEIDNSPHLAGTLTGDYIVRDVDGDGDVDPDDRIDLGTFNPDFTYAFGANLKYNNFDFSFTFTGVEGRKAYDHQTAAGLEVGEGFTNASQYYFDNRYHPVNNPNGFFAQPNTGNFSSARKNTRMSSITVSDGDYLRLRSMQLGYVFSEKIIEKIGISKLRVYVSANNLFTITNFRGHNSEGGSNLSTNSLSQGYIGRGATAIPKTVSVGLNLTF